MTEPKIYILHENEEWIAPLRANLKKIGVPFETWHLNEGSLDLKATPPNGVFYNRMSASSHTRGHKHAKDLTAPILAWLQAHGRRVVNKRRSLQLEVSKAEQQIELQLFGILTPETHLAAGKEQILMTSKVFGDKPFILKPNQGGKGQGVTLINNQAELELFLSVTRMEDFTIDGVTLIQEYVQPKDQRIIRMEFVGGKFYYAVEVKTGGGFELCPADGCEIPSEQNSTIPEFTILKDFNIPEIQPCEDFLRANDIEIAGIEFLEDENGKRYFYDVNTNTNYNSGAEKKSGSHEGMRAVASFLNEELNKLDLVGV